MNNKTFPNHEIVTLAVYLLGGDTKEIDTEDVAVKANQMAPGRFAWFEYRNQIKIKNVNTSLLDAKKLKNGRYLIGSCKKGWLLTEAGLKFVKDHMEDLKNFGLKRVSMSKEERAWRKLVKARMLTSPTLRKLLSEGSDSIMVREAEYFFYVDDDYITGYARKSKMTRLVNSFKDDPDIGHAIRVLSGKVRRI